MQQWFVKFHQNLSIHHQCTALKDEAADKKADNNEQKAGDLLANPMLAPTLDPPVKRSSAAETHRYFLTKRGVHLFIPGGAEIGETVHTWTPQGDGEPLPVLVRDEIVALANATSTAD
jgi:hypothetical protein